MGREKSITVYSKNDDEIQIRFKEYSEIRTESGVVIRPLTMEFLDAHLIGVNGPEREISAAQLFDEYEINWEDVE